MGRQMKRVAVAAAALAVLGLLCAALSLYLRPVEDRAYDLSVTPRTEAVPEDWVFDDKGWSVYVREGEGLPPHSHRHRGIYRPDGERPDLLPLPDA